MTSVRWTRAEAEQAAAAKAGHRANTDCSECQIRTAAVLDALGLPAATFTVTDGQLEQVGVLIDDAEFVPLDIVREHTPFAVPPGTVVDPVYRVVSS